MRFVLLVLAVACAHAPLKESVFGKRVGLGEVVGDRDATAALKDALNETFAFELPNPQLHLHVDASTSGFDEPVQSMQVTDGKTPTQPRMMQRVQTMRATLRLVDDGSGEVVALGVYEVMEKGPERPPGAMASDDLTTILARRVVRKFVEQNHL